MSNFRKYGLIGYPLSHTFSPSYFAKKFEKLGITDAEYRAYPLQQIEEVRDLKRNNISGFNVTIPYKQAIIPYLDQLSTASRAIGAVNTVKHVDGKWIGYNTDVYGIQNSLQLLIGDSCVDAALILGTGGASKAVQYVLSEMNIKYQLVSRRPELLNYEEITKDIMDDHRLIINTTPLGMSPYEDYCPLLPYRFLDSRYFIFDLIYNPKKTLFLTRAEERGATIMNGLQMLYDQADKSWQIWNT